MQTNYEPEHDFSQEIRASNRLIVVEDLSQEEPDILKKSYIRLSGHKHKSERFSKRLQLWKN